LKNGIFPEEIVAKYGDGEMMLLINVDQIKAYEKGVEELGL